MGRQWLGGSLLLKINLSFGANWLIRNRSKQLCHLLGFRKYIHVNCLTNIWRKQSYFIRRPFNKLGCHHLYSSKQFDWQQPSDLEIKERGRLWFNVTVSVWFVVLKKVDDDNNSFSLSLSREDSRWVASVLPAPLWVPAEGGSRPRPGYCSTEKKSAIPLSVTGVRRKAWVWVFSGDRWKDKRKERIPMFKCSLNQHGRRKEGLKSSSCNALGKKWLMVLPVTHQLLWEGGGGGRHDICQKNYTTGVFGPKILP